MRRLRYRLAFVALALLIVSAAQAQSGSEEQGEFSATVNNWKAVLEKQIQGNVKITLPSDLKEIAGLPKPVLVDGKNVIAAASNSFFSKCMEQAASALAIEEARRSAAHDAVAQMTLVAVANSTAMANRCQEALHSSVQEALRGLQKSDTRISELIVTVGADAFRLMGNIKPEELAKISQQLVAFRSKGGADLSTIAAPFVEKYIDHVAVDKFIAKKVPELRAIASTVIRSLPAKIDPKLSFGNRAEEVGLARDGLNVVVGIAFRSKPEVVANLTRRVNDLAKVAQIAITLGSMTNPMQAALASFSGAGALGSLFGSGGGVSAAFNQLILDQVNALRSDIQTLRGEMHERFDAIERTLAAMSDMMTKRFDKIDHGIANILRSSTS